MIKRFGMTMKMAGGGTGLGLKIKYKILLVMLLVSIIPLAGLWYISIYATYQKASTDIDDKLIATAEHLRNRVEDWYGMNHMILQQNSAIDDVRSMDSARQNPVLETITNTYKWIYLAFTVFPDGQNAGRSDGQVLQYYGDREYFQQVMQGHLLGQQVVIGRTSEEPALILAAPIYGSGNHRDGVMAFAMTLEDLSKSVTDISIGETGFAILLDDKNQVVARGKGLSSQLENLSGHPAVVAAGQGNRQPFIIEEGGKQIIVCGQKTKHGWTLIVQQDYDEAFVNPMQTRRNALILFGITAASVVVLAFLLSAGIAGPIRSLTLVADNMSRGELDVAIKETGRRDEIGALARAIERMGISLQMAFKRMRK